MDSRFPYNMLLYYAGIIAGRDKDKFLLLLRTKWLWVISILGFVVLLALSERMGNKLIGLMSWFAGVGAILSLSSMIEMFTKNSRFIRIVLSGAYGSMAYYLFHRFFYWLATERVCMSSEWMFLYLFVVIFPLGWVASFWIQKGYDSVMRHFKI